MKNSILEAINGAASLQDLGHHADFGAWKANQKKTPQVLTPGTPG